MLHRSSAQRTPQHKGPLSTKDPSAQRTPQHRGPLYTKDPSAQRTPQHKGPLSTKDPSAQRTPQHKGPLSTKDPSAQRIPQHKGPLSTKDPSAQRTPQHTGPLSTKETWAEARWGSQASLYRRSIGAVLAAPKPVHHSLNKLLPWLHHMTSCHPLWGHARPGTLGGLKAKVSYVQGLLTGHLLCSIRNAKDVLMMS